MARRSREVGIIKSYILGAALAAGLATAVQADDKKLTLSATTVFTTDYIFRGYSNTTNGPAVQPEFDLFYGIFYAGIWGSNVDFGAVDGRNIANVEIDYYAGITPKWRDITFNIGGLYYTYPGYCQSKCGLGEPDYFELKTGAAYTFGEKLTVGLTNYWSPDYFGAFGSSDAIEGSAVYAFSGKLFNFFSPSVGGLLGFQSFEDVAPDYTYWNVGLTLGFMEHWSADVRYWDTDLGDTGCAAVTGFTNNCDERVVGTIKAVF